MNKPQVESFDLSSILSKGFTNFTLFSCYTTKENKKIKCSAFLFKMKNKIKAYSFISPGEISLIGVFKSKNNPIIKSVANSPILCIGEGKNINFYSTVIDDRNIGEKIYSLKCSEDVISFEITKKVLAISYRDKTDVYHIRFNERWGINIKSKETLNEGSLLKRVNDNILISLDDGKVITKYSTFHSMNERSPLIELREQGNSSLSNSKNESSLFSKNESSFLFGEEIISSDNLIFSKNVFIGEGLILIPEGDHVTVFTMGDNEILTIIDTSTSSISYHNGVLASLYEENNIFILVLFNLNTLTNEVGEFLNKINSKGIMNVSEKSEKLTTYDDDVYFVVQLLTDRQMKLDGGDYKKYRPNRDRDRQLEGNW